MKKIILAILVAGLMLLSGCIITNTTDSEDSQTINVQGTSELTFEPDQAEIWAGISIVKTTAEEAQSEANKIINAMISGLKTEGISEDDLETEQLSIYEERRWEEGTSTVVGWRATQTLKIKTSNMDKVGIIVDTAVENGANQINNINFGLTEEKEQEYKKQALAEATKNAKEKAEVIAENLEVRLGKIKTVSESNYYYAPYRYALTDSAAGAKISEEAASIIPGEVEVSGSISITYYVK